MLIYSLEFDTPSDYNGNLNSTIALTGCNFRCGFCHNSHLIKAKGDISEEEVLKQLKDTNWFYNSICITGGEPTLYGNELVDLTRKIKDLGYKIKLDSNGSNPDLLEKLIDKKLIDCVGMDIKGALSQYEEITGYVNVDNIKRSIDIVKKMDEHEFRTTVLPRYHGVEEIAEMGNLIKGAKLYVLQQFQTKFGCLDKEFESYDTYSEDELKELSKIVQDNVEEVRIKCN